MLALELKYAYAMGRVRALETRLLDRGRVDRMVDSPDLDGALKVLAEAGYSRAQPAERVRPSIDDVIGAEEDKLTSVIRETTPEPALLEFITARRDFHNVKVALKARLYRVASDRALARGGTIDPAAIERAVDGDPRAIPPYLSTALDAARAAHAARPAPDSIDTAVDREMFGYMLALALAVGIPFLVELVRTEIDVYNLGVFFRSARFGRDRESVAAALAPGGRIDPARLVSSYDRGPEAALGAVSGTGYEDVAREAAAAAARGASLVELERAFDAAMWERIRRARYVPLGPEPLIGYIFAKMHELKLARFILAAKVAGMSRESIRERLRDVIA